MQNSAMFGISIANFLHVLSDSDSESTQRGIFFLFDLFSLSFELITSKKKEEKKDKKGKTLN